MYELRPVTLFGKIVYGIFASACAIACTALLVITVAHACHTLGRVAALILSPT